MLRGGLKNSKEKLLIFPPFSVAFFTFFKKKLLV